MIKMKLMKFFFYIFEFFAIGAAVHAVMRPLDGWSEFGAVLLIGIAVVAVHSWLYKQFFDDTEAHATT